MGRVRGGQPRLDVRGVFVTVVVVAVEVVALELLYFERDAVEEVQAVEESA